MNLCRCGILPILVLTIALAPLGFSARAASTKNYAGLVYSGSNNVASQSGIFNFSLSTNRNFSGEMLIGNHRPANLAGRFNTNGAAESVVEIIVEITDVDGSPQFQTKTLGHVQFQLSPAGDSVSGTLLFHHGGIPDAMVFGKRSSFNSTNKVPSRGIFTFVLAGSGDPANTNFPTGNGVGGIDIGPPGWVIFDGRLADEAPFSLGSTLCDDGTFPVFYPLYNGNGMIQGWLGPTNSPDTDVTGDLIWVKPDFARRTFFPAGFTNDVAVIGSRYVRTNPVVNWTNGVLIFQGGQLSSPFTNSVFLNAKGAVLNVSNNKPALKIRMKSGQFFGSTKELTGKPVSFIGVILQKQNSGFGFFPDAPLSGQVLLGPAP